MLRFRATIAAGLAIGTRITNTGVVTWNNPPQTASASVSIDIGGMPGVGVLNGTAWHDTDFDDTLDTAERRARGLDRRALSRRRARVLERDRRGRRVPDQRRCRRTTRTGEVYELRFLAPGAAATTAALGRAASDFTNYLQRITDIVVQPGANLQNLNLPIDPNGVVYNSITRTPIAGAVLTLLDAGTGTALPASCFDDPAHQNQVTLASGWYKFEINFNDPACPSGGNYLIGVSVPGSGLRRRATRSSSRRSPVPRPRRSRCRPARPAPMTRSPARRSTARCRRPSSRRRHRCRRAARAPTTTCT